MLVAQDDRRIYQTRGNAKLQCLLMLGGGILGLLVVIVLFISQLNRSQRAVDFQPGIIGGLTVIPIMLITRGVFLLSGVYRVILDKDGISLQAPLSSRTIPWTKIEHIGQKERSLIMGENQDVLELLGSSGKKLAEIRDNVDQFPELVEQITDRSAAARGAPTLAAEEDAASLKKE